MDVAERPARGALSVTVSVGVTSVGHRSRRRARSAGGHGPGARPGAPAATTVTVQRRSGRRVVRTDTGASSGRAARREDWGAALCSVSGHGALCRLGGGGGNWACPGVGPPAEPAGRRAWPRLCEHVQPCSAAMSAYAASAGCWRRVIQQAGGGRASICRWLPGAGPSREAAAPASCCYLAQWTVTERADTSALAARCRRPAVFAGSWWPRRPRTERWPAR